MLRNLLIMMSCVFAVVALAGHFVGSAVLLIMVAAALFFVHAHYAHILEKHLNYLAAQLAQILVTAGIIVAVTALLARSDLLHASFFGVALGFSLLPVALLPALQGKAANSRSKLAQYRIMTIMRCALSISATTCWLVLLCLLGLVIMHISPVFTLPQLIVVSFFALVAPLRALQHDKHRQKLPQLTAHRMREATLSLKALKSYLGFGLLTAAFAYASYLLTFGQHHLSPQYVDTSLPLHHEATTTALVTLTVCFYLAILFERVDRHDRFFTSYLTANKRLLQAFGLGLALLILVIYIPGLQTLFQTAPLSFIDWLIALLLAATYAACRLLQRHTRQHTRRAVVNLHQEVHSR